MTVERLARLGNRRETMICAVGDDESRNEPADTVPTKLFAGMPVPETGSPWSANWIPPSVMVDDDVV